MSNDLPRITDILEGYKDVITPSIYEKLCIDVRTAFNDTSHKLDESTEKLRKENMSMSNTIADLREDIELFKLIIYHLLDD